MPVERRKYLRAPLSIAVHYGAEDRRPVDAFTHTLGGGGLFIETTSPDPPDTKLNMEFYLPGESKRRTVVEGRVIWIRERFDGDYPPGMGVQYTRISREDRERINDLILRVLKGAE